MVERSLRQKLLLVVKGKQLETLRRASRRTTLRSTATGWWSPSPRAALRTASTWRCVVTSPTLLQSAAVDSQVWFTFQFGIEDLKAMLDQTSCWDGVRNFQVGQSNRNIPKSPASLFYVTLTSDDLWPQARNFMRQMKKGQLAFFYHSNCKEPGIAGLMKASQAPGPPTLRLAEILQPSAGCFIKSRSLRKRMWTTHSSIRKTSTLTPGVSLTTPNGAW